jgi:glycosyltransferase involved in cell wall biosynthesis
VRVVHLPFRYYPDAAGGTEVYVAALAQEMIVQGVGASVAAAEPVDRVYMHDGVPVQRFAANFHIADPRELYDEGDEVAAREFGRLLDEEHPDIVHLHAFTRQISLRVVREAKARAIPVFFTYHTPTVSCQRGSMMHRGVSPCGGVMDLHTCARCTLQGLGMNRVTADAVGSLPAACGAWLGERGLRGGVWTALRLTDLLQRRHDSVRALFAEADHIIAVCDWVRQVLLRNGVPDAKITLCRQGLAGNLPFAVLPRPPRAQRTLRVVYFGRLDPVKGVDVLIRAVQAIKAVPLQLNIYGILQDGDGTRYANELRRLAAGDHRIRFLPPAPASEVVALLAGYDVLAVPSQWLETGPLVVLEAFAAGVPVLGSRRGGIGEIVRDGIDGLLVEPAQVSAWSNALEALATDPAILDRLRAGVRPPTTMREVAATMIQLYKGLR